MVKENVRKYYIDQNLNCAEATLHAAADAWGLQLPTEAYRAVGPFGGGMCCGNTCGALAGALAAIGCRYIEEDMHASPEAKEKALQFMRAFKQQFDTTLCSQLKARYANGELRCLELVEQVAQLLDTCGEHTCGGQSRS